LGTIFTRPAPKNLCLQKIVQNFSRFLKTFDFDRQNLRNGLTYRKSETFLKIYNTSHVREKKVVYFGRQTKKLLSLINLHRNGLFSGDYILALRGCCALKFSHALQIDQVLLAHTPIGMGVPPKNFNRENLKFGPNFRVLRSITVG